MERSHFGRRPPMYSRELDPSEAAPPYREIPSPPPYPTVPSPEYLNEKFRYFYLYKRKDAWMPALADFLAKNKDYTFELFGNDTGLRIILPEDCYMSMEFEELRNKRKNVEAALKRGKVLRYWQIDRPKNYSTQVGLIESKLRTEYQKRLEQDELFRWMEATKTASTISKELSQSVWDFFSPF